MIKLRCALAFLVVTVCLAPLYAVTYVVPPDAQLIQTSDDIVVATGVTSLVERDERGGIVTRYTLRIEDVLKGERTAGDYLVVTERGGLLGGAIKYIPGTPEYQSGEQYIVFTEMNVEGELRTNGMGLGQFYLVKNGGRTLALRGELHGFDQNLESFAEKARDARAFTEYIRAIANQKPALLDYFVGDAPSSWHAKTEWDVETLATRGSYLMVASGKPFRWFTPTASFVKSGAAVGVDGNAAVSLANSQWNGTSSDISYSSGGQDDTALGGLDVEDGKNAILFNDPNNEVNGSVAGIGGISNGGNPYSLDGEDFWRMLEVDVVMNNGSFAQNCYNTVMVHEVGHTLGFRHSDQPPVGGETTTSAVMNSTVQCSWNGVLKQYDKDAAATVYGNGPVCTQPSIATQPQNKTIGVGGTTSLSVVAAGTSPFTYQWYIGASNTDTTNPTGGNSSTLPSLSPAVTTKYWVKVTNACGNASSNDATVTVQECSPPSITTQPSNKTVTLGSFVKMSVGATGSAPLSYQWYNGNSGDTSNPISGATTASPNLIPSATVNVWVRVTGQCAPVADSNAATITVNACADVVVGTPSATGAATNWTLSVNATSLANGPLLYEWYKGSNPGSNVAPKVGEGSSLAVVVNTVTQYWVRVTNSCGSSAVSGLVVVAPCQLPVIAAQPADRTIAKGGTTLLTVGEVAEGVAVQWYRGTAPDKTAPLTPGPSVQVVSLQETTSYWASLTNDCGEVPTRTVIVTVDDSCAGPVITTQPEDRSVLAGTTTQLSVGFTGENVTVQWYEGVAPDTSRPIGAGASILSPPVNLPTAFWARLTNACGEASTRTVQVGVAGTCEVPVITTQPVAVQSANPGETVTLSLVATGTPLLKYEWFEGVVGTTDKPVGTDSPLFTTPPLTAGARYWARVSNPCGSTISRGAEIKIGPGRRRAARH